MIKRIILLLLPIVLLAVNKPALYLDDDGYQAEFGVNDTLVTQSLTVSGSISGNLNLARLGNSTYSNAQHLFNFSLSPGISSGGTISNGTSATVNIAAGTGFVKNTDSNVATNQFMDFSQAVSASIPISTTRYIGVTNIAGSAQVTVTSTDSWDLDTSFPLGVVVNEGNTLYILNNPWITSDNMANVIERFDSLSTVSRDSRVGGLALGNTGTRNVTVSAGALLARMSEFNVSAIDTSGANTFDAYYRDGSGGWTKQSSQTQWDNTSYDDGDGTLGSLALLGFSSRWFYLMTDGSLAMVYGQGTFTSLALVLNDPMPASVPERINRMGILIGRIIAQQGTNTPSSVQSAFGTSFTAANVENHNDLANIQGGSAGQYYHLTSAQATSVTSIDNIYVNVSGDTMTGKLMGSAGITASYLHSASSVTGTIINHSNGVVSYGLGNGSVEGRPRGVGANDLQTSRATTSQAAWGEYSSVLGGSNNRASFDGTATTLGLGFTGHSSVGGGKGNSSNADGSFIGGGNLNTNNGVISFIGGGFSNSTNGLASYIGGGNTNRIIETSLALSGYSAIGAGSNNTITDGASSFILGGDSNTINGAASAFIGAGTGHNIGITAGTSAIVAGNGNTITANSAGSFIGGGNTNTLTGNNSFIGSGANNTVTAANATIIGGSSNQVSGTFSLASGNSNIAEAYAQTVFGLFSSTPTALSSSTFVSGDLLFILGNGPDAVSRSNAFQITGSGRVSAAYSVYASNNISSPNIYAGKYHFSDGTSLTTNNHNSLSGIQRDVSNGIVGQNYHLTASAAASAEILDSLYINTSGDQMLGPLILTGGTSSNTALGFNGEPNTGLYSSTAGQMDWAVLGLRYFHLSSVLKDVQVNPDSSSDISFRVKSSPDVDAFVVQAHNGNVGIGVRTSVGVSAASKLEVSGSISSKGANVSGPISGNTGYFVTSLGVGDASPGSLMVSVKQSSTAADPIGIPASVVSMFQGNGNAQVNLSITDPGTLSVFSFGDAADYNIGAVEYNHAIDSMAFRVNDSNRMSISSSGNISNTGTVYAGGLLTASAGTSVTGNITATGSGAFGTNLTVDTNSLIVNGSTNNVGIGITSPAARLHTQEATGLGTTAGNSQILQRISGLSSNATNRDTFLKRDSNGSDWNTASIHDSISIDASFLTPGTDTRTWWERNAFDQTQKWGTAATTYMTLFSGGNLGIGTTNSTSKLSVSGTTSITGLLTTAIGISTTGGHTLTGSVQATQAIISGANGILLNNSTAGLIDSTGTVLRVRNTVASGASAIQVDPMSTDGTSSAQFRLFRNTNTTSTSTGQTWELGDGNNTNVHSLYVKTGTISVFNEQGNDMDFRWEGDTNINLLYLDASTDRVGVGISTPSSSFSVSGTTFSGTMTGSSLPVTNSGRVAVYAEGGTVSIGSSGTDPANNAVLGQMNFYSTDTSAGARQVSGYVLSKNTGGGSWSASAASWDGNLEFGTVSDGVLSTKVTISSSGVLTASNGISVTGNLTVTGQSVDTLDVSQRISVTGNADVGNRLRVMTNSFPNSATFEVHGSAMISGPIDWSFINMGRSSYIDEEFYPNTTTSGQIGKYGWKYASADDSPSVFPSFTFSTAISDQSHFGVGQLLGANEFQHQSMIYMGNSGGDIYRLGGGPLKFEASIYIPTLASAGEDYDIIVGLCSNLPSVATRFTSCTNGVYFLYDRTTSTSWITASCASGACTTNTSSPAVTVAAGSWIKLTAEAVGGVVNYYINGAFINSHSTNIPNTSPQLCGPIFSISEAAGGSVQNSFYFDYWSSGIRYTTPK